MNVSDLLKASNSRTREERRELIASVAGLLNEIERLKEDNRQLRAAVQVYREVARRTMTAESHG